MRPGTPIASIFSRHVQLASAGAPPRGAPPRRTPLTHLQIAHIRAKLHNVVDLWMLAREVHLLEH